LVLIILQTGLYFEKQFVMVPSFCEPLGPLHKQLVIIFIADDHHIWNSSDPSTAVTQYTSNNFMSFCLYKMMHN